MKPTNGPWSIIPWGQDSRTAKDIKAVIGGKQNREIGRIIFLDDEALANARLIAAAPDLLEAAKIADATFQNEGRSCEFPPRAALRAAIAKAEDK